PVRGHHLGAGDRAAVPRRSVDRREAAQAGARVTKGRPELGRGVAGAGGALLIASLFLPWTSTEEAQRTGFELLTMADVFLLVVALTAIGAAITWKRYGLFRPDMSVNGAADLLGV